MSRADEAVIVSAVRTPIGKFCGQFADLSAVELGVVATKAALAAARIDPTEVELAYVGNGRQAGGGPNPARQVALGSGMGNGAVATTINQACASGLKSIILAASEIWLGQARVVVAGGIESMTRLPFLLPRARMGYRLGHDQMVDAMYQDGFLCPMSKMLMGETAEKLAALYGISRAEQDAFAADSQRKAEAAIAAGRFAAEIAPVDVPRKGGALRVDKDEHPRAGVTTEALAKLPPVFKDDGTVHAGNSSGITDGAAALVLMAAEEAERRGIEPLACVWAHASSGVDPSIMGIGPVGATDSLSRQTNLAAADYDLVEMNEAFAAQVLACQRDMRIDPARLNVNGGAIALGHPIGATGARIAVTLVHELVRRGGRHGLATLCVSGGMGVSVAFERA